MGPCCWGPSQRWEHPRGRAQRWEWPRCRRSGRPQGQEWPEPAVASPQQTRPGHVAGTAWPESVLRVQRCAAASAWLAMNFV